MIVFLALFPLFSSSDSAKVALVIHGGAGAIKRQELTAEREKEYLDALRQALQTGYSILKNGGRSLDAVEAVIRFMEDSPLFNAGKGAVLNAEGKVELDASIMDGKTMMAGAVAAVTTIKNPITAARKVMEKSPHVMLIGGGAEKFAAEVGLEIVNPSYFYTERRHQELLKEKQKEKQKQESQNNHGT
ncbi:MAG TPA: isoaspartyl peptidase/L-asparaginase, partial [Acidobacteriota bacterium]|nr:isoaspartyl peptidase/L-asparaginase [Acidobacteriota bacterium]